MSVPGNTLIYPWNFSQIWLLLQRVISGHPSFLLPFSPASECVLSASPSFDESVFLHPALLLWATSVKFLILFPSRTDVEDLDCMFVKSKYASDDWLQTLWVPFKTFHVVIKVTVLCLTLLRIFAFLCLVLWQFFHLLPSVQGCQQQCQVLRDSSQAERGDWKAEDSGWKGVNMMKFWTGCTTLSHCYYHHHHTYGSWCLKQLFLVSVPERTEGQGAE